MTIGLDEEAYDRLKAQKREGESFGDTVKRITEEVSTDWRTGFGSLWEGEGERLEEIVSIHRTATNEGLAVRQRRAFDAMTNETEEWDFSTPRF